MSRKKKPLVALRLGVESLETAQSALGPAHVAAPHSQADADRPAWVGTAHPGQSHGQGGEQRHAADDEAHRYRWDGNRVGPLCDASAARHDRQHADGAGPRRRARHAPGCFDRWHVDWNDHA